MSTHNTAADPNSTPRVLPVQTEASVRQSHPAEGTGECSTRSEPPSMNDLALEAIGDLEELLSRTNPLPGLSTGLAGFDAITGGLQPGQLGVIAGRPAMGKTAFVMQTALHVSLRLQKTVAVFSLQSNARQLFQRLLYSFAGVPAKKFRLGIADRHDWSEFTRAAKILAKSRMLIDDDPGLSVFELRDRVRHWKSLHDVQLVVVDKMACLESGTRIGSPPHRFSFDEVTLNLKAMARELNIPVLGVADLNRKPDERLGMNRGWPQLKDLRKRKAIVGVADFVALLLRHSYYAENKRERKKFGGRSDLMLFKNMRRLPQVLPLVFDKTFLRFEEPRLPEIF